MNARVMLINLSSIIAILSLLIGLAAAILAFTGEWDLDRFKLVFNLASLAWFVTAPLWFTPQTFGQAWKDAGGQAWLRPRAK